MGSIERCGIIVDGVFYEVDNISNNPYEFIVNPEEFYSIIRNGKELQAIVHTHVKNCTPSGFDVENMKIWKVYWIIISSNCIKAYKYSSSLGVIEVDINSLPFEVSDNFFVKLLK
jgi:proteasome lid subunit RPN8/RPN11